MEINFLWSALLLGLISSFHCIGMCGPIALSLGIDSRDKFKFHTLNLTYQLGRVTTYSIMGLLLGLLGSGLHLLVYQKYISIGAGVLLLLMVFLPGKTTEIGNQFKFLNKSMINIKLFLAQYLQRKDYKSRYITGVLNGLLPCGPVYVALAASLAAGGFLQSTFYMTLYGLGTLPLMYVAVIAGKLLSVPIRNKINTIYPFIIVFIGVIFILRGLELGIPLLSPPSEVLQINSIKDCCHP